MMKVLIVLPKVIFQEEAGACCCGSLRDVSVNFLFMGFLVIFYSIYCFISNSIFLHSNIQNILKMKNDIFEAFKQNPNPNKEGAGRSSAPGFDLNGVINAAYDQNKFDKEKLDRMYRFPADFKEAKVHRIASKFGYSHSKLKNNESVPVCPCCENFTSTMDIPLCYSTLPGQPMEGNEVFLLETDVSMYFTFIKMATVYLLIRFLVFDIYNILASKDGHYCASLIGSKEACAYTISGYNLKSAQDQDALNIIDILSLAFTLISIVFFLIYRKKQFRLRDWLDFNEVSQDDFSVLIEYVPRFIYEEDTTKEEIDYYYEYQIKDRISDKLYQWLEEMDNFQSEDDARDKLEKDFYKFVYTKNKVKNSDENRLYQIELVTSITLCYDLTEIENLNKFRDKMVGEYLQKNEADEPKKTELISHIPNQIDVLNQEYINLCKKFALDDSAAFNLSHFTGKAFVSLQYQHFRDYLVKQYEKDPGFLNICGTDIKISKTNQPPDIYWYNMKVTDSERSMNIFYSYAILFMLLVLSFVGLIGLQFWQVAEENKQAGTSMTDKLKGYLVTGSMAILTNVINFVLSTSIELLSEMERHKTKSDKLSSLIFKTILTQTINTSIIYTILYLIKHTNPLSAFGIVSKIVSLVVVSGFISVAMQVFIPKVLVMGLINRWKYPEDKPVNLFQLQLNQMLQYPEFNYAAMYSFYIVYTFVVSFYGFLVPTATPILIIIFFIQYWVDKYNLFRRFSSPAPFGQDLIRMVLKSFEVSLLIFVVGYIFWGSQVHYDSQPIYRTLNLINLVIAVLYTAFSLFVPYRLKVKILGEDEQSFERLPYSHYRSKNTFEKTFWRENPATACLKQTKIRKEKDMIEEVNEAPDLQFIKNSQFDKYLNLTDNDYEIEKYSKKIIKYIANMGNEDYDYAEDQGSVIEADIDKDRKSKPADHSKK